MIEVNKIYNEDCRETLKRMPDNFVDSIVTDPPYDLTTTKRWGKETKFSQTQSDIGKRFSKGFMGKEWDGTGIAFEVELWKECLRILKPGGYLLSFGGTRTSHRMVCAIEDAGFEIRDSILWLYGSGFPKSMNIGNGWGTALKPAHEPICVARKSLSEKTVAENVLKYGTGGINIDECRIETKEKLSFKFQGRGANMAYHKNNNKSNDVTVREGIWENNNGRFPANVILDEFTATELDKQVPDAGAFAKVKKGHNGKSRGIYGDYATRGDDGDTFYDDKGGASRFFYIAKADREERNAGLQQFKENPMIWSSGTQNPGSFQSEGTNRASQNNHPTVKPVKLIQYLQRLVTPKGGLTYDPFGGSGTSALSASNEGFNWILSEIITEYCDIANKRIYHNSGLFLKEAT